MNYCIWLLLYTNGINKLRIPISGRINMLFGFESAASLQIAPIVMHDHDLFIENVSVNKCGNLNEFLITCFIY